VLVPLAALVLVAVAPEANSAAATPITSCGQVVTTNAFLTGDLVCAGSHGVVVGASKIAIDLKGFMLWGDRFFGYHGVYDSGFDGVTIKNGLVRNFHSGILASANEVSVMNVLASGNDNYGIFIIGDSATVKSSTGSGNNGPGIGITGDGARVQSSTASGNHGGRGIIVVGAKAKIQSSTASGNPDFGIVVNGDQPVLKGNRAEANGFTDGASDSAGTGILVEGYTTAPKGKNVVRGNDNPNECDPTYLC